MPERTASERTPAPPERRRPTGAWAVVAVLLAVGIVVPLLVGLYDSETPVLWGFPFYYWFQFLLIPIVSTLTYTAFRLSLRATERDRPTFGLPPQPGEAGDERGERR
jgi:membrane protein implicated in regulation of membrane protease activity